MSGEFDCLVSVGICTYNQKQLCRDLVKGLLDYGPSDIRVFVYDNNPEPPVHKQLGNLAKDSRVEIILDPTNPGYIIPNNRMAAACRSKYHIVSNDDVVVGPKWFESLVKHFDDPKIACVGPMPNFGCVDDLGRASKVPPGVAADYVEGWWMMFPRHIIDRYGLFDEENLKVATCEDSHLCLCLQEIGWKIKVIKNIPIQHLESQTKKSLNQIDWGSENSHFFVQRWGNYLRNKINGFPKHTILVKNDRITIKKLKELRWKYPYSQISVLLGNGVVDGLKNDESGNYNMVI